MMEWIHCNTCFTVPGDNKLQFGLTSCGHLYCEKCVSKEKHCKTCGQTYSGIISLSNQMKPDVQVYFMDIKELCKNTIKQLQQVQQVSEFQKGHTQRLLASRKKQLSKASDMMAQARELERKYRIVCKENEIMKEFLSSKGYNIQELLPERNQQNYPMTPKTPARLQPHKTPNMMTPATPSTVVYPTSGKRQFHGSSYAMQSTGSSPNMSRSGVSPVHRRLSPANSQMVSPNSSRFASNRKTPIGTGPSPNGRSGSCSNLVAQGRLSVRTPPINGRIGKISPMGSSPRSSAHGNRSMNSPSPLSQQQYHNQHSQVTPQVRTPSSSKISQSLNTLKMNKTPEYRLISPNQKRPISLMQPPSAKLNRN